MNRFLYAHANPTTLIDPDGHRALEATSYVAPPTISVPHGAESVSSTTYVSKSSTTSTGTTWTPTSRTDRDDWENSYVAPVDCGFERLGCRSDIWASGAGLGMGLGQSVWDIGAGLWDLGAATIDDTLCSADPVCAYQRMLEGQARSAAFWADPLGNVGQGIEDTWNGVGTGLQQLNDSIFHARSGFEGWRSFGHATGTVVSLAAPGVGVLRAGHGISTAERLTRIATTAASRVGPGRGAVHGTLVHSAFERLVVGLNRSDLHAEVSYYLGAAVRRGFPGSIRVDVVQGSRVAPIAIYDLKTGGAALTLSRIAQIRAHLPAGYGAIPINTVRPR
jgi:hypothetical protein